MQKYTITPVLIRQEYQRRLTHFCLEAQLADILHFFDHSHAYSLYSLDHEMYPDDYHHFPKQCGLYRKDGSFTSCGECRMLFKAASQAVIQRPELKTLFSGARSDCPICTNTSTHHLKGTHHDQTQRARLTTDSSNINA